MKYTTLHKWHIWLGWLIGVPLILWTLSGLFMVLIPIEEIRGEHLRAELPPVEASLNPVAPKMQYRAVRRLELQNQPGGAVWVLQYTDGGKRRADVKTGDFLPEISAIDARRLAQGYYAGEKAIASVQKFTEDKAPFDLRCNRPSWQISLIDDTRFYIDADSGELLAVRTPRWRVFDFMWGLHIMDLQTREDTSHPTLIFFAAISLLAVLIGFTMQFWRPGWLRRKKQKSGG